MMTAATSPPQQHPVLPWAWICAGVLFLTMALAVPLAGRPWHPPDAHSALPHHAATVVVSAHPVAPELQLAAEPDPVRPAGADDPTPLHGQFSPKPPQHPPR